MLVFQLVMSQSQLLLTPSFFGVGLHHQPAILEKNDKSGIEVLQSLASELFLGGFGNFFTRSRFYEIGADHWTHLSCMMIFMVRYHTLYVVSIMLCPHVPSYMSTLVLQSLMTKSSWSPSKSNLHERTHSKSTEIGPKDEMHLDDSPMVVY